MLNSLRETFSREAVGYRRGELEDGDGVATMVVTLIGGPAVVVGSFLLTSGLDLGEILLVAPVGALLGAFVVGSSAAMAAQTGAAGSWLLRPAFGRGGSLLVSLARLVMVVLWAIIALHIGGEWAEGSLVRMGVAVPSMVATGVVALLGFLLLLVGLVRTVRVVIRKPLFILSVLLVGAMAWLLAGRSPQLSEAGGSFWAGVQLAVEAAVVFLPFVEVVARRLRDDEVAMSSFAVGYAVPATLMFAAGAFLAAAGGVGDSNALGTGVVAVTVMVAWVVVAEVDQVFSSLVAVGSEAVSVLRFGPSWLIGLLAALGVVAGAVAVPELPLELAHMAAAVVFPAALISALDFHLVRDRYYTEADIYGSTEGAVNVSGVGCWLGAVIIGQLLDPIGPPGWVGMMPETAVAGTDLPWRLIAAVVAAALYFLIERWGSTRRTSVYGIRGVAAYGQQAEE